MNVELDTDRFQKYFCLIGTESVQKETDCKYVVNPVTVTTMLSMAETTKYFIIALIVVIVNSHAASIIRRTQVNLFYSLCVNAQNQFLCVSPV